MTTTGLVTMAAVLLFVWGGFAVFVVTAIRRERQKTRARSGEDT